MTVLGDLEVGMNQKFLAKQKGIGLLEILLVLAVIATILLLAFRYYESARSSQNINTTITMVSDIHKAAIIYAKRKDYSNMSLTKLKEAGLLTDAQISSPWGGSIVITGTATQVLIQFSNLPASACTEISKRLQKTLRQSSSTEMVSCSSGTTLIVWYDLF